MQGYYLSPPLPGPELTPWLRSPQVGPRSLSSLAPEESHTHAAVVPLRAGRAVARAFA